MKHQHSTFYLYLLLSLITTSALTGCANPDIDGRLEQFNDKMKPLRTNATVNVQGNRTDFSGSYVLGLNTQFGIFYFNFAPTVEQDLSKFSVKIQAIGAKDKGKEHQLVGEVFEYKDIEITDSGTFVLPLGKQTYDGAANPATGADFTVDVTLEGTISSADNVCGLAKGQIYSPVDVPLDNTFGTKKYDGDASKIPSLKVPIQCPKSGEPNTNDPNTDDPNTDDPNTDDPNTDDPNTNDPNTGTVPDDPNGGPKPTPKKGIYLCSKVVNLEGKWAFEFKQNEGQDERTNLIVTFEKATEDPDKNCFKGTVSAPNDENKALGQINSFVMENGELIFRMPELKIPEGPNQGAKLHMAGQTEAFTDDALCGKYGSILTKDGSETKIPGTWSMAKEGATSIIRSEDPKVSGCEAVKTKADCSFFDDIVKDDVTSYKTLIKTASGESPSVIAIKKNPLSCLSGVLHAIDDPKKVAGYITSSASKSFLITGFHVPQSVAAFNFEEYGGWGTNELTIARVNKMKSFCGSNKINFEIGAKIVTNTSGNYSANESELPKNIKCN